MLEIKGVSKSYASGGVRRVVLNKVTIDFRANEFVAILGPSGSGKTTLLNIVGGLDKYGSGDLVINEKSTKKFRDKDWDAYRNHRVGFIFQAYNLIPHQTVLANVRLALTLSGISKHESIKRAKKALRDVGLAEHMYKRPAQLSGGQMQRVAIARALVNDPDILLADEPTGALDSETSIQIMNLLKKIAKNKLVIMVTHNPELADEYATRIVTLKDGKITSDSNPYDGSVKTDLMLEEAQRKSKKTKMSFLTALSLSLNNLLTKKGRTLLVAFAGSIGIIGIALISAVSTGFQGYIDKIESDTLTSYPLALQKESADLTGVLLNMSGEGDNPETNGKLKENQILTSTLGTVSNNDLKSFQEYLERHEDEVSQDIRLLESSYNVDPMIYSVDVTSKLVKLNPSNLFTSLIGETSLLSNYSSMTSVFQQYELENLEDNTEILAGRYPEKYNEMVVILSSRNQISDLLTYSLGFHDTEELNEIVSKILSGEKVEINSEPLELSYDDLMNVDLRLVLPADTYHYNDKYDIYEDMSQDKAYMQNLYAESERMKIVGVAVSDAEMLSSGSGVAYLPSLVEHIINESAATDIVKRQLEHPEIDVFSGSKFGEEANDFNFEFSDLVSVDNDALAKAFNITIDQNAISAKTAEYMNDISKEITADVSPVKDTLLSGFDEMQKGIYTKISGLDGKGTFKGSDVENIVDDYLISYDFTSLATEYLIPVDNFREAYRGLLTGLLGVYVQGYAEMIYEQTGMQPDMSTLDVSMIQILYNNIVEEYLKVYEVDKTFDTLSIMITELIMKKEILAKVSGLTSYLVGSFADAYHVDEGALLSAFRLNFSEEELTRVVTAMFTKKKTTLATNLSALGYQDLDDPTRLSFYFNSFDGKTHFMKFLDEYNDLMKSWNQEDKVIEYTDTAGVLMSSVKTIVDAVSYVLIAFVSISLVVSSIMIGVITYISVYERTKEIGILRAIGASKRNISNIFNAETFIIGLLSGLFGVVISYLLIPIINLVLHHFTGDIPLNVTLDLKTALFLVVLSIILTLVAGLIPSHSASKKNPVEALRSE